MTKTHLILSLSTLLLFLTGSATFAQDSVSIKGLQSKEFKSELKLESITYARELYTGSLMSYLSDGLKVYALVNRPTAKAPKSGYPVLIFAHGFHPEPKKYGITPKGEVSRPGDYYRNIPEAYAEKGFLVVTPDYRGHNISEGFEFTKTSYLASSYYAADVLNALAALPTLNDADLSRVYLLGHSMGGDVGLKVLLASNKIKAASFWAPVAATTNEQAIYYGKYYDDSHAPDDAQVDGKVFAEYSKKIDELYAALPKEVSKESVDPIHYLDQLTTPIMIQHARGDQSVPYIWSESLFVKLIAAEKEAFLHSYNSNNHLFKAENKAKAIQRDIDFFNAY